MRTIRPAGLARNRSRQPARASRPGLEPGELHNGTFSYECAGATDAWCETQFRHGGRPLLGVGAPFRVRYSDSVTRAGATGAICTLPTSLSL